MVWEAQSPGQRRYLRVGEELWMEEGADYRARVARWREVLGEQCLIAPC